MVEGNRTVTMTIRLTVEEKKNIRECARKLNMTQTEVISNGVAIIKGMIEKHEQNLREGTKE